MNFPWWSVDMLSEEMVLEIKVSSRNHIPGVCCVQRFGDVKIRVGNDDPAVAAVVGEPFK